MVEEWQATRGVGAAALKQKRLRCRRDFRLASITHLATNILWFRNLFNFAENSEGRGWEG